MNFWAGWAKLSEIFLARKENKIFENFKIYVRAENENSKILFGGDKFLSNPIYKL